MCAGYVQYMTDIFKRSKNSDVRIMQDSLNKTGIETLASLDGSKIISFHGK